MLIVPVLLLTVLFMGLFFRERRTIWIGILFLFWIAMLSVYTIITLEVSEAKVALGIALLLAGLFVLGTPFYLVSFVWLLITSGLRLIRREGRRLRNFLSVGLGVFLIAWAVGPIFIGVPKNPVWQGVYGYLTFCVYYFFFLMLCFTVASWLNRIRLTVRPYDYIIVLGSGLIGGQVTPLLASRIDRGIELFRKRQIRNLAPVLIFTGGQGADEDQSEGKAMAGYAMSQGIDERNIIIEDKAVNTYENLLFSKRLMESDAEAKGLTRKLRTVIVTNNFHLFRSLLWARKVGLRCEGSGSKTKFYFWLNALIREFIGMLAMQKKVHTFVLGAVLIVTVAFVLISLYVV